MATPEDLVARALDRRLERDRGLPNIEKLLRILIAPFQAIEVALQGFLEVLPLANATRWVLDEIYGPLLALPRRGVWDDETYRYHLSTQILALRSSGTAPELLELGRRFAPTGQPLADTRILMRYPASVILELPDVPADLQTLALQTLERAVAQGVNVHVVFYDTAGTFRFAPPGATHGLGVGVFGEGATVHLSTTY